MGVLEYDCLEILDYLKRSVRRMQQIASNNPGGLAKCFLPSPMRSQRTPPHWRSS